jgi:polysaccharide export outer membrane protein
LNPELLRPPTDPFTLGPGDHLEIEVLGDPQNRATVTLGPDGKVYFFLLPGVDLWGLTLAQAKERLEQELTKYQTGARIGLTLRGIESKRVWLLGRLNTAGVYPLGAPMSLLESISLAGGTFTTAGAPDELADLQRSFVIREGQLLPVDFQRLLRGGDMSQNIYLKPDDFVYLPSALSQDIYVLGAVRSPLTIPHSGQATIVSAVASAGGTIKHAYLSHVAIVRGSLAEPKIAIVDYKDIIQGKAPDIRLEPRDIVYVPFTPYRTLVKYGELIVHTFVRAVAINEGSRAVSRNPIPVGVNIGVGTP